MKNLRASPDSASRRYAHTRGAAIEAIISSPPADVAPMRVIFSRTVSEQWEEHIPHVLATCGQGVSNSQFAKARFIAQMYARACYSMLLVSGTQPLTVAVPLRAGAILPLSRSLAIWLASALLAGMGRLLPRNLHRRLLLTSALMAMLDVVLDDAAVAGQSAALRVASLLVRPAPTKLLAAEQTIMALVNAARENETDWQKEYWERVLQPAVQDYCQAEVLAIQSIPDPQKMGHRWPGIDAAIKGMWYAVGPELGLRGDLSRFDQARWNREQKWMADTSLLMQMIDDWMDQDEDRSVRLTPVLAGDWTLDSVGQLYDRTIRDLVMLLDTAGIHSRALRTVVTDLYNDYLHAAMDAMSSGLAA